jgi:hypothetical protein
MKMLNESKRIRTATEIENYEIANKRWKDNLKKNIHSTSKSLKKT